MIPNAANLQALVGKQVTMDPKLLESQPAGGVMVRSWGVNVDASGNALSLTRVESGGGLWVPYATGKAVVGYLDGAKTWAASGPFSGCEFAVGKSKKTGQVFAAHIAKESGSSGEKDYAAFRSAQDLSEWYWNKIPLPNEKAFSCSYVFVGAGGGGITFMARMDVDVTKMGGSDGKITGVHKFK